MAKNFYQARCGPFTTTSSAFESFSNFINIVIDNMLYSASADVSTFVMSVLKLIVNPAVLLSVIILVGVTAYLHYQRRVMYQKKLKKVSAELSQERQDLRTLYRNLAQQKKKH